MNIQFLTKPIKWVEVSGLTFTRTVNLVNGQMSEFELIPDGRNILVNDHNRKQFVQSYAWNSMELVQGESIDARRASCPKGTVRRHPCRATLITVTRRSRTFGVRAPENIRRSLEKGDDIRASRVHYG